MQKLFIANWKSNKTEQMITEWFSGFHADTIPDEAKVLVAPSYHLLSTAQRLLPDNLFLAAQDVSAFPMGSYTGAVNAQQLKSAGVDFVILGHSERRQYFRETHEDVAAKLSEAVQNALTPILCVDKEYIRAQAATLDLTKTPNLIVAYEPVAAIGSGNNAPVDEVEAVTQEIKTVFGDVPVIYGGSVDERNVRDYLMISDGVLIGGASLDASQFLNIVQTAKV